MERLRKILEDPQYIRYQEWTRQWELERPYCHHNEQHFLDTARIAWILVLERGRSFRRDIVYAAAFLHDAARWKEYGDGKYDHALESALLAAPILQGAGFSMEEIEVISTAIAEHRRPPGDCASELGGILSEADKLSRRCWSCAASDGCRRYAQMATRSGPLY